MTPADQAKLCALLNTGNPRIVWEPDPARVGGGIFARLGNAGQMHVRREVYTRYAKLTLQPRMFGVEPPRPVHTFQGATVKGPGWHARAADVLRGMATVAVVTCLRWLDGEFDALLAEPETSECAQKLCKLEERRTALANCIGAC